MLHMGLRKGTMHQGNAASAIQDSRQHVCGSVLGQILLHLFHLGDISNAR
ncbi:Uncharacterised protein [Mycobacterium tuberculosis]|nr:Uncharacterised protein [Mycobacterium tuberculosis]